jgi:hypothetical protein
MRRIKYLAAVMVIFMGAAVMAASYVETDTLTGIEQINENGFGTEANKYSFSMAVFDDSLYVGTLNVKKMPGMVNFFAATSTKRSSNGAEIWRYDKDGTWTNVVKKGLTNPENFGVRKMVTIGDYVYGVTVNHDSGMEVWRSANGNDWEAVVTGGFGNVKNTSGRGLGEFNGHIYVGVENRKQGAEVYRSVDGTNWECVVKGGLGDKRNDWFSDFAVFKGQLYSGTLNITGGAQVVRTSDGVNFEKVAENGFDKKTNTAAMKLIVFKDKLYVTTMDFLKGYDLYVTSDGTNWKKVHEKGHTNRHNAYLWQLEEYNGRLYAGTYYHKLPWPSGAFMLYSTADGENWTVENDNGFGNPFHYGVRSMAVYDGKLIIGSASPRYGTKVFSASAK